MGRYGFRQLRVWEKAKDLAVYIYRISHAGALARDLSLRDQIRRSAVSIASNIAEGDERNTDREAVRFFYIAKGSLAELRTQIEIARESGHLEEPEFRNVESQCQAVGKMLGSLIKARSRSLGS